MVSGARLERFGHLPGLQRVAHFFPFFQRCSRSEFRQFSAVACRVVVLRIFFCCFGKVCSVFEQAVNRVDFRFSLFLLPFGGFGLHHYIYMCHPEYVRVAHLCLYFVVNAAGHGILECLVGEVFSQQPVAVAVVFLFEGFGRVELLLACLLYFQAVVDVQVHVVGHACSRCLVFVVGVFEFRAVHVSPVYFHYYGVVGCLCRQRGRCYEKA